MGSKQIITISQDEYNDLLEADNMLNALYAAGVQDWDGYNIALDIAGADE